MPAEQDKLLDFSMMKKQSRYLWLTVLAVLLAFSLEGCASSANPTPEDMAAQFLADQTKGAIDGLEEKKVPENSGFHTYPFGLGLHFQKALLASFAFLLAGM